MTGPFPQEPDAEARPDSNEPDLTLGMDTVSPSVLIDLLQKHRTGGGCTRFRRHERHKCQVPATVEIPGLGAPPTRVLTLEVQTEDVSASGFAFVTSRMLAIGSVLRVQFDPMQKTPALPATVRRCVAVGDNEYRIGAEFAGPRAR